jgi:hypothetical protein
MPARDQRGRNFERALLHPTDFQFWQQLHHA